MPTGEAVTDIGGELDRPSIGRPTGACGVITLFLVARHGGLIIGAWGELPTGTIAMLFSDTEGSTVLLSGLGDRHGEALSAQRALLRAAFSSYDGREMRTEPDSFSWCLSRQRMRSDAAWQRNALFPGMPGLAGSRCGSGWACTRGSQFGTRTGTSGWMLTGRRGLRRRPTVARVADPDLVPAAVAAALGMQQDRRGGSVMEALAEVLAAWQVLLVLDNCEHLIGAARPGQWQGSFVRFAPIRRAPR